ncbi:MAG: phosphoglycolate phosphatase [Candidatus Saganbacteria bacterium]|uniref:Phosphoglycolate phosphatase n=1 Tax=Candidatus Saganbacteria bacterium TaxID=2575572 RepID=A0A833P033_UNCSA|nr:MAG: phosphoglycolate phosphatase [Candidatus Saganbacteria bacterium]
MPLPIDLFIFDFDGTLADSIPAAVKSIQAMILELGFAPKTDEEIFKFVGYGEVPLVSGAISSKDPKVIERAMRVYFKHYLDNGIKNIKLYPGIKEILEYYKDKVKIIISNKKDEFIRLILTEKEIIKCFDEIFGGDNAPCLKPDPCVIIKALNKYKIKKEKALIVGDMTIDVETGRNAGIRTCAATYGFQSKDELLQAKPDFVIDGIRELEKLFN